MECTGSESKRGEPNLRPTRLLNQNEGHLLQAVPPSDKNQGLCTVSASKYMIEVMKTQTVITANVDDGVQIAQEEMVSVSMTFLHRQKH